MNKKMFKWGILGLLVMMLLSPAVYACEGGSCKGGGEGGWGKSHHQKSPCPVTNKFFDDAHEMLEHKEELGLTPEQVQTIKGLKMEMKKSEIRKMADMQIFMIDLKAKLHEDKINTEAINAMIDQQSAAMASSGKQIVEQYIKLKGVLTPEQAAKMKTVKH